MRTEIITRNIYTFAELSDDAKPNALNSWRESGIDFDNDAEFILDMWKERLENIGFTTKTYLTKGQTKWLTIILILKQHGASS